MRKFNTRILSLLMALVMSFSLVITAFAADTSSTGDDWVIPDGAFLIYDPDDYSPIGYQTADGHVILFNDNSTWEDTQPTQDVPTNDYDQTQPDSIEIPTNDTIFTDEDLALVTKFSDVKVSAWYYNDVTQCAKLGIVAGFEDGTFRPEDKVSSVQLITMLTRTFYADKLDTATKSKPAGTPWYWANKKVADDVGMSKNLAAVDDNPMNRYEMAVALRNVAINNGKRLTADQSANAIQSIKDYTKIPSNYRTPVKTCYGLGIITGMSDGTFAGTQNMTRAQACTVIIRMLKLIGNYNPGDKDNDQYDDGKNQNDNDNNQNTTSKLANGQPATIANVEAILAQIKREYPDGTIFQVKGTPNNNWYNHTCATNHDVRKLMNSANAGNLNLQYGCGGFVCMVSERIFGTTGAPAREVTDVSKLRPGDIVLSYDKDGKIKHAAIVEYVGRNPDQGNEWRYGACEANANSPICWETAGQYPTGRLGMLSSGSSRRAFTRYSD